MLVIWLFTKICLIGEGKGKEIGTGIGTEKGTMNDTGTTIDTGKVQGIRSAKIEKGGRLQRLMLLLYVYILNFYVGWVFCK